MEIQIVLTEKGKVVMSKNQMWLLVAGLMMAVACACIVIAGGIVLYTMLRNQAADSHLTPTENALPADGLVAYYPLDGSAEDKSGNKNHGQEYGGIEYVEGRVGKAASFDGVDDYIEIIPQGGSLVLGDFTISAWIYLEDWKAQDSSQKDRQYIFDGHSNSTTSTSDFYRDGFALVYDESQEGVKVEMHALIYYRSDGGQYLEQNTGVDVKGHWHFIVFMRKGIDDYVYIDGELATPTYYRDYKSDTLLDMKHRWFVGTFCGNNPYYNGGAFNYSFYGLVDELRIYSRALSLAEIETLYSAQ